MLLLRALRNFDISWRRCRTVVGGTGWGCSDDDDDGDPVYSGDTPHHSPQAKPNARTASIDRNSLTALSPPSFRRAPLPSGA